MIEHAHLYIPHHIKISPCSSCGKSAKLYYDDYLCWEQRKKKRVFFVRCPHKGCFTCGSKKNSEEDAIKSWNSGEVV